MISKKSESLAIHSLSAHHFNDAHKS